MLYMYIWSFMINTYIPVSVLIIDLHVHITKTNCKYWYYQCIGSFEKGNLFYIAYLQTLTFFLWFISWYHGFYGDFQCLWTPMAPVSRPRSSTSPRKGTWFNAKGSRQIYQTLRCSLRFRTQVDKQLCVKFNSFRIDDCSVHFKVFQENQPVNFGRQPSEDCLYVNIPLTLFKLTSAEGFSEIFWSKFFCCPSSS